MGDPTAWGESFGTSRMDVYEEVLVGRMFEPWAETMLDLVGVGAGDRVLDVACGPGSVTRVTARRVGSTGSVVGCDLSPAMLAIAESKPHAEGWGTISYRRCPADTLAVDDGTFDVVVCQHGLQFFPDRLAALREMRRAGRPGARVAVAVWSHIDSCPPFAALGDAIEEILGVEAAAGYRGGPWGFPDTGELHELMGAAGFDEVEIAQDTLPIDLEGGVDQLLSSVLAAPVGEQVAALAPPELDELRAAVGRAVASLVEDGAIRSHTTSNTAVARV